MGDVVDVLNGKGPLRVSYALSTNPIYLPSLGEQFPMHVPVSFAH